MKYYSIVFKKLLLPIIFTFFAASVFANCVPFSDKGLFCAKSDFKNKDLLVFIRGLYGGNGNLSSREERIKAAQIAFNDFHLGDLNRPVLILGSSHLSLSPEDFVQLGDLFNGQNIGPIKEYTIAAHSGGYAGLFETLSLVLEGKIEAPKAIYMLDNFYSVQEKNLSIYKEILNKNVICKGFFTTHNQIRYETLYKNPACLVQGPEGFEHNASVFPQLKKFLN